MFCVMPLNCLQLLPHSTIKQQNPECEREQCKWSNSVRAVTGTWEAEASLGAWRDNVSEKKGGMKGKRKARGKTEREEISQCSL